MKHVRTSTLGAVFVGICALLLTGCGKSAPAGETKAALTVTLVTPASAEWPVQLAASGSIAAWQESIIGAEVNGLKLDEVLVNVGDTVRKDQLLARFSEDTTRADLAYAEATVAQAEANLTLARDQAARARRLEGSGTVSSEQLLQYDVSEKTNAAQLASAKAQLEAQRLKLRYTQVLAPDDGVISSRTATAGAVLGSGSELFRLIRQNRLEWRASIPTNQLSLVSPGQTVVLKSTDQSLVTGRVRQVSPVVDADTLDGTVYVDVPDPGPLKAGMYVSGHVEIAAKPSLHVPESALVYRDGYQYLMKVDASRKVRQLKVTTGRRQDKEVEITGGLAATDQLVASGGSFLNEGDTVQIAPEKKSADQTSTAQAKTPGGAS